MRLRCTFHAPKLCATAHLPTPWRAHIPGQVIMCKHRLGMVCAASGDHRAAMQLLGSSREHYLKGDATHALAKEADLGLAMAR